MRKQIIYFLVLMIALSGCASSVLSSVSTPTQVNDNLPTINELRSLVDTKEVGLEWNPINNDLVDGFYILRSTGDSSNLVAIKKIDDPYASHFVDTSVAPFTKYRYEVKTYKGNEISKDGTIINVTTSGKLPPLSFVRVTYLQNGARIIWHPSEDERVTYYEIQRATKQSSDYKTIARVDGRLAAEYIDRISNPKEYEYRVIANSPEFSSNPTPAAAL